MHCPIEGAQENNKQSCKIYRIRRPKWRENGMPPHLLDYASPPLCVTLESILKTMHCPAYTARECAHRLIGEHRHWRALLALLVLCTLFVVAQQGALTHEFSHYAAQSTPAQDPAKQTPNGSLCHDCVAFAQIAGAVG